ncbi:hypothetical protein PYCC9005_005211 [Savitreella phatthalungensis]
MPPTISSPTDFRHVSHNLVDAIMLASAGTGAGTDSLSLAVAPAPVPAPPPNEQPIKQSSGKRNRRSIWRLFAPGRKPRKQEPESDGSTISESDARACHDDGKWDTCSLSTAASRSTVDLTTPIRPPLRHGRSAMTIRSESASPNCLSLSSSSSTSSSSSPSPASVNKPTSFYLQHGRQVHSTTVLVGRERLAGRHLRETAGRISAVWLGTAGETRPAGHLATMPLPLP